MNIKSKIKQYKRKEILKMELKRLRSYFLFDAVIKAPLIEDGHHIRIGSIITIIDGDGFLAYPKRITKPIAKYYELEYKE